MDWNLKAPSWDITGVDESTTLLNIETMDESTRFGVYRTKGEFSVDLKLGQVGNSGPDSLVVPKSRDAAHAGVSKVVSSSSPSGSYKRARAVNNGSVTVSCLVDGCDSDLSTCRDYHRRHKVCEQHSKTPEVTIGGLTQRFCQQCSRFHSLDQFDEGKRSCRRRLDGHNRRRRKPQPEPLRRPSSFLSNYQGTQLLPFSSPHVYSSTAVVSPAWSTGLVTSCADASLHSHNQHHQQVHNLVDKQDLFLGSSPSSYKEGNNKLFAFLHGDNATLNNNQNLPLPAANSVCQTLLRTNPLSESGVVRSKVFCDSLASSVHDPPCALSLLSSSQTHGNGLSQMVQQPHTMSLMQPLGLSLHGYNSLESMDRVLVPNGSDHFSSMYDNMGSDGSRGNEAPQLFPFQWE